MQSLLLTQEASALFTSSDFVAALKALQEKYPGVASLIQNIVSELPPPITAGPYTAECEKTDFIIKYYKINYDDIPEGYKAKECFFRILNSDCEYRFECGTIITGEPKDTPIEIIDAPIEVIDAPIEEQPLEIPV